MLVKDVNNCVRGTFCGCIFQFTVPLQTMTLELLCLNCGVLNIEQDQSVHVHQGLYSVVTLNSITVNNLTTWNKLNGIINMTFTLNFTGATFSF